jgi:hypothetical protein
MAFHGHNVGDIVYLEIEKASLEINHFFGTDFQPVHIVGTYSHGLQRGIGRLGPATVMPLEGLWYVSDGTPGWMPAWMRIMIPGQARQPIMTARFVADPLRNREIHLLQAAAARIAPENTIGTAHIPLEFVLDDEVLVNIIAPMEQSLRLFRILYPVALASAFVLAFGLALLTLLQSAKNAAIMRVLGKKKSATCTALIAEQMFVCIFGAAVGLALLPILGIVTGVVLFGLAGIYLAGALVGSWVGAMIITAKPPLELLQIRE